MFGSVEAVRLRHELLQQQENTTRTFGRGAAPSTIKEDFLQLPCCRLRVGREWYRPAQLLASQSSLAEQGKGSGNMVRNGRSTGFRIPPPHTLALGPGPSARTPVSSSMPPPNCTWPGAISPNWTLPRVHYSRDRVTALGDMHVPDKWGSSSEQPRYQSTSFR